MKKQIKLKDAIGQTLEAVEFSGGWAAEQVLMVFADGTFAVLGVERDDEQDSAEIVEASLDLYWFETAKLIRSGIGTPDEIMDMEQAIWDKKLAQQEAKDRAELARLKAKYGE